MPYPLSGYSVGGVSSGISSKASSTETDGRKGYWSLDRLRRAYLDYLGTKREEIDEQQDARRIVHGSQWTAEQVRMLNARRQPVTTNNQLSRKIHGVVGTLERLRQDPKAYPRTPKHEQGAELATGALRYALESQEWQAKDPICSEMCAIDGLSGLEFNLTQGDHGDVEVEIEPVITDSFFYDPRSYRHDFSDARYMGVGKWMDLDAAIDLYPDFEEELNDSVEVGDDLSSEPDREFKWFHAYGNVRRVRIIDLWYKMRGDWYYCVFTGNTKLMEGKSYLVDEKGETQCKYEMFSAYIDQDGDRYGLVRNLKPLQQQINMRESKALYTSLSRGIVAEKGAFDDVEVARREASRSDGIVIRNKGFEAEFNDAARNQEFVAQLQFLENIKKDFESFGPNVSLLGQGLENASGRAINLLQQAGLADLGPFIQSYRGWKIRVYRKMWNAIQKHWGGERWIRVTDDDDLTQFIQINGTSIDPMTGLPVMVNAIGSLDVDIILDEGPDSVNQMADAYDALTALVQGGTQIPPMALIELAPIPVSVKNKVKELMSPSDPQSQQDQQRVKQAQIAQAEAEAMATGAEAKLKEAQAIKALAEANAPPDVNIDQGEDPRLTEAELAKKAAEIEKIRAEAAKTQQEMQLEPVRMQMEHEHKQTEMAMSAKQNEQKMAMDREANQNKMSIEREKMSADQPAKVKLGGKTFDYDKMNEDAANSKQSIDQITRQLDVFARGITQIGMSMEAIGRDVAEMKDDMNSPVTVERDKSGRAIGATKGKRKITFDRDAKTGRVKGAK